MLAARGHIFMPRYPAKRVARAQQLGHLRKAPILCFGEPVRAVTYEFNAN